MGNHVHDVRVCLELVGTPRTTTDVIAQVHCPHLQASAPLQPRRDRTDLCGHGVRLPSKFFMRFAESPQHWICPWSPHQFLPGKTLQKICRGKGTRSTSLHGVRRRDHVSRGHVHLRMELATAYTMDRVDHRYYSEGFSVWATARVGVLDNIFLGVYVGNIYHVFGGVYLPRRLVRLLLRIPNHETEWLSAVMAPLHLRPLLVNLYFETSWVPPSLCSQQQCTPLSPINGRARSSH
jgi:hypothetical protein